MGAKSVILGTVDDLELDIESWQVGFERQRESNGQRRLHVAPTPTIMAESAQDREVVPRFQAGAEWPFFQDGAREVAEGVSRLPVASGRREVVLIASVTFVDQPVQPFVVQTRSPVENRQRTVGKEIADEIAVLEPRSASGDGGRGLVGVSETTDPPGMTGVRTRAPSTSSRPCRGNGLGFQTCPAPAKCGRA